MRDGRTRKLPRSGPPGGLHDFLTGHRARLVVIEGGGLGTELPLDQERLTLGRGPGVDVTFDDELTAACEAAWWSLPRRPVLEGYR